MTLFPFLASISQSANIRWAFLFYVLITCVQKADGAQLDKIKDAQASNKYEIQLPEQPGERDVRNASLPEIARLTVARKFANSPESVDTFVRRFKVPDRFKKRAGLFVTFSKKGKTRTCWGSIEPRYANLVEGTVKTTASALANDYKYVSLKPEEIKELKPQVTVIKRVVPVSSLSAINPYVDGLMVRKGTKTGVILPGEASDSYYELMLCKVKAQIAPKENCQLYRIVADVYK